MDREPESNGSASPARELVPAAEPCFDAAYGLEYGEIGAGWVRGRLELAHRHLGVSGTVHGGIYAAIAESLAFTGTVAEVPGVSIWCLSNSSFVLREVRKGVLEAQGRCRSRGAGEWVWEVDVAEAAGATCAIATVVIAVGTLADP